MKIFLAIVASIIIISALLIGYAYNKLTFRPDYFDTIEETDRESVSERKKTLEKRIIEELEEEGAAKLSGDDVMLVGLDQLQRETDLDLAPFITKSKSELSHGKFRTEAIVNIRSLSQQNMSPQARKDLDVIMQYLPQALTEEVYISLEATPVVKKGSIYLADDIVVAIGDFVQKVPETNRLRDFRIDIDRFRRRVPADIIIHDNHIELVKK